MSKKHYMCTHTWATTEAEKAFLENTKGMTDRQLFEGISTKNAELLQHWMGKEDFFYCHWYAESEEAIFESLEISGFNDLMVSMPNEMHRYVSADNITDDPLIVPSEVKD
jgi:hypothetical protein|tara:strand:- start:523 stop:852 length:330 start_codon:yes stop_codon:yes gene_type:complete